MKLSEIIAELKAANKTTVKRQILAREKNNITLKRLLTLTSDKAFTFWIKADPEKICDGDGDVDLNLLNEICDQLHGRHVTGNAARDYLAGVLQNLTRPEGQLIVSMINRDQDCKVSTSLINDTWKDAIFKFPVMLADKFNEKTAKPFYEAESDTEKNLIIQLKCDGGRCTYVPGEGGYSRNASKLLTHDKFEFMDVLFEGYAVDGELLTIGPDGKFLDRKTSNGIYNKAVRETISVEEAEKLHFVVWDLIPIAEFRARKGTTPYRTRLANLESILSQNKEFSKSVSLVESEYIHSVAEGQEFYARMLARKEEGAMLKLANAPWEDDRSSNILKLKEELEGTLRCVATIPHNKKPGQIGSLVLQTRCGLLETQCGSGLTDEDRVKDPSEFVNKLVDVKYNALIKSKGRDTYSMFLPIFKNLRVDILEADTLKKLKG